MMTIDQVHRMFSMENLYAVNSEDREHMDTAHEVGTLLARLVETSEAFREFLVGVAETSGGDPIKAFVAGTYIGARLATRAHEISELERMAGE